RTFPKLGSLAKHNDESNPPPTTQLHCFYTMAEPSVNAQPGSPWQVTDAGFDWCGKSNCHVGWSSSHDSAHLQSSMTQTRSQSRVAQRRAPKSLKRLLWPCKLSTPASEPASTTHPDRIARKLMQEQCILSPDEFLQRAHSSHRPVRPRRSSSVAPANRKRYQATIDPVQQQAMSVDYPSRDVSLAFDCMNPAASVVNNDRQGTRTESRAGQYISSLPVTWAANYTGNGPDLQGADAQTPVKTDKYPTPGQSPDHDRDQCWDQGAYWQPEPSNEVQLPERRYFPLSVALASPTRKPAHPPTFQRLIRGIRSARSIKSLTKLSQSALRGKPVLTAPPSPDYDTWPQALTSPQLVPAYSLADGPPFHHSSPIYRSESMDSTPEHFLPHSSYGFDEDQAGKLLMPVVYQEAPPPSLPTPPPSSPSSLSIASVDSVILPPRTSSLPNFVLRPHRLASHTPIRSTLPKLKLKPAPKSRQASVRVRSRTKAKTSPRPAHSVDNDAHQPLVGAMPVRAAPLPTKARVPSLGRLHWWPPVSRSITLTRINISRQDLTDMSSLQGCRLATHLCLARNRLRRLPTCIADFQQLTHFDLSYNRLHHLTAQLGDLAQLVDLNLAHNLLTQIPVTIGQLANLCSLSLLGNPLIKLPHSMAALFPTLKSFHLGAWPTEGLVIDRCHFELVSNDAPTGVASSHHDPVNAACPTPHQASSTQGQFVHLERQILRRMMTLLVSQLDRVEHQAVAVPWPTTHSYDASMPNTTVTNCHVTPAMAQVPSSVSSAPGHPARNTPGLGADDYQRLFATFKVYENVLRRASRNASCTAN
ncbi:hypothetical protein H4R35_006149, partial [Dimargaris xerosporica]